MSPMSLRKKHRGFSLLELLIVLSIILVLAAFSVPKMFTVIANIKLRSAATSLAGALQNARMLAVKSNRTMTVRFTAIQNSPYAYIKDATAASTAIAQTDYQVQLGAPIIQVDTPTGTVTPLDPTVLGYTPLTLPDLASFNPRGLPCKYVSGVCTTNGFAFYFTDKRQLGGSGWTAVSVSPAGRVTQWFWYGNSWGH